MTDYKKQPIDPKKQQTNPNKDFSQNKDKQMKSDPMKDPSRSANQSTHQSKPQQQTFKK